MKKLLILSASMLILSSGSAYAQLVQTSEIDQNGDGNNATVDQTLGQEGLSDINQVGDTNTADVTQSENLIGSNIFTVPSNVADIDQIGNNHYASQ